MWIIVGDRTRTAPVEDGLRVRRQCPSCSRVTTFVEHRMLTSFRLYFVDIVNHDARHVMVCDGCGATFVTDELKGRAPEVTQEGTVAGAVGSAFKATRGALTDAATRTRDAFESGKVDAALSQTRDAAGRLLGDLFGGRGKKRR